MAETSDRKFLLLVTVGPCLTRIAKRSYVRHIIAYADETANTSACLTCRFGHCMHYEPQNHGSRLLSFDVPFINNFRTCIHHSVVHIPHIVFHCNPDFPGTGMSSDATIDQQDDGSEHCKVPARHSKILIERCQTFPKGRGRWYKTRRCVNV